VGELNLLPNLELISREISAKVNNRPVQIFCALQLLSHLFFVFKNVLEPKRQQSDRGRSFPLHSGRRTAAKHLRLCLDGTSGG
jgi:hypothetical protein